MWLSDEAVQEFGKLYETRFGESLSENKIRQKAENFLSYIALIAPDDVRNVVLGLDQLEPQSTSDAPIGRALRQYNRGL